MTSESFYIYVFEILNRFGNFSAKKMMGEYLVYLNGELVGGLYDDRLLLKPTEKIKDFLPYAEPVLPYDGAKTPMIPFSDFENGERVEALVRVLNTRG